MKTWSFKLRTNGYEETVAIWLHPEIYGVPMLDDFLHLNGEDQLAIYLAWIMAAKADLWKADAVPIYWSIRGEGIAETAPFTQEPYGDENFLTFYSWPQDVETGEALDWFSDLPVQDTRYPDFADALGWRPSPLQATAPLRSILKSKQDGPKQLRREQHLRYDRPREAEND